MQEPSITLLKNAETRRTLTNWLRTEYDREFSLSGVYLGRNAVISLKADALEVFVAKLTSNGKAGLQRQVSCLGKVAAFGLEGYEVLSSRDNTKIVSTDAFGDELNAFVQPATGDRIWFSHHKTDWEALGKMLWLLGEALNRDTDLTEFSNQRLDVESIVETVDRYSFDKLEQKLERSWGIKIIEFYRTLMGESGVAAGVLVHGDAQVGNTRCSGKQGRLKPFFVDFEDARIGHPMEDCASMLWSAWAKRTSEENLTALAVGLLAEFKEPRHNADILPHLAYLRHIVWIDYLIRANANPDLITYACQSLWLLSDWLPILSTNLKMELRHSHPSRV